MEIDWSKAPEGTTHALARNGKTHWRKEVGPCMLAWQEGRWATLVVPRALDYAERPLIQDEVQEIRHIIANALMIGGDPALALVAHGYRKFEIVEEDAQ